VAIRIAVAPLQPALDDAPFGDLGFIAPLVAAEPHRTGRSTPALFVHDGPIAEQARQD
jgi:hypothetical protein